MANKQYIGARYVPLIDGDWNENKVYEPLTVVNYLNNSYTSKKTVPAGTLPTNSTYWALTGNYNAGLGALTERVDAIEEDVNGVKRDIENINNVEIPALETKVEAVAAGAAHNLSSRNFIFIADSYGVLGWTSGVISRLGLTAHAINIGGAGFYAQGGGTTFQEGLEDYAATLSADDKAAVTDIIVLGGINDYGQGIANIGAAIDSFIAYAKLNFTNAKIGCGCLSWCARDNDVSLYINQVITTYQKKFSASAGCYYIPNMYLPLHDYSLIQSDGIHPTDSGTAAIINHVCNWLLTGDADYIVQNKGNITPISGAASGTFGIDCTMDKNGVDFHLHFSEINLATPKNFNDFGAMVNIATISGGCVRGNVPQNSTGNASIVLTSYGYVLDANNTSSPATFSISIYDGLIGIAGVAFNTSGATVTASKLYIAPVTAHVGLLAS